MRALRLWGMAAGLLLVCGCQRDISGTYLARDKGAVCWLQLVRTPDDHLSGQLATSVIEPDGTIHRDSAPITGVVNEGLVSISATRFFGLETRTLSGTLRGGTLTLSGPEGTPFVLRRSGLKDYDRRLAELEANAGQVRNAKRTAEVHAQAKTAVEQSIADMNRAVARMQQFDREADLHLARFVGAERRYQDLTQRMEGYVARERELLGPNATVGRSQLTVAATQVSLATDQLHIEGQNLKQTLTTNVTPIAAQVATLEQNCRDMAKAATLLVAQPEDRELACQRLLAAGPPFRQRYDAVAAGLDRLEQVYLQQQKLQQGLLQTAEALE